MTNQVTRSPYIIDTNGTTLFSASTGTKYIQLIQWLDDNADIANDDTIVLVINGNTITGKVQLEADKANNLVVWEMKFSPYTKVDSFVVTSMGHGVLVVWEA